MTGHRQLLQIHIFDCMLVGVVAGMLAMVDKMVEVAAIAVEAIGIHG